MSEAIADSALKERPRANWFEGRFRMVPTPVIKGLIGECELAHLVGGPELR